MKTLIVLFALVNGTTGATPTTPSISGLHFVITIDQQELQLHNEFTAQVCDTLAESEYAIFKSKDYILACRNHNLYQEKGLQSEVKAYFNDEEITMDDAYVMMNNRNVQEAREYAEKSRERLAQIMNDSKNIKMHYSITLSLDNDTTVLKKYMSSYVFALKESGDQRLITLGKFITFTDVKVLYDELLASGITNLSITASEFGKEIAVSTAVGKEQEYLQQLLAINE